MPMFLKEHLEISFVNISVVPIIDRLVCFVVIKCFAWLHHLLHFFSDSIESYFSTKIIQLVITLTFQRDESSLIQSPSLRNQSSIQDS
jgi:hypothetical protein